MAVLPRFTDLFAMHLHRRGNLSPTAFGQLLDPPIGHSIMSRIMRGERPPDVDALEAWADKLELVDQERRDFVLAGGLANCPPTIVAEWERMIEERMDVDRRILGLQAIIERLEARDRERPPAERPPAPRAR